MYDRSSATPAWAVQAPPRRAAPPAASWPLVGLGVVAAVMLVTSWGVAGVRAGEPAPVQPTATAFEAAPPPVDGAPAQARAIDALLDDSVASRAELAPALQQLTDCRNLAGAMAVVATVRDERDQQRGVARSLATDLLPDGAALQNALVKAFDMSYEADINYLDWGQALQSRGCEGSHAGVRRWDSEAVLARRAEAKADLIRRWNRVAALHGLSRRKSGDI